MLSVRSIELFSRDVSLTFNADKVRLLYDRDLPTARVVVRSAEHLDPPLVVFFDLVYDQPLMSVHIEHDALLPASYESNSH